MRIDETLYQTFLEEMDELDRFRMSYTSLHPGAPLDREDPDVRRLIEAMALLSARTRLAGVRHNSATRRRIFQQFFPYLLTPLPSMAVLQAVPTGMFADTACYPKGSEIVLAPESGGTAIFQTLHTLNILPVVLDDLGTVQLPDAVTRLMLRLKTSFARNDEIGQLRFFINHLNDYETSLAIHSALQRHVLKATVVFDEHADQKTAGMPCDITFGRVQDEVDVTHPLEKERLFFHFPWQELFINIEVPQPVGSWTTFTLCLDLAPDWPVTLALTPELFHLFAVPIANLRQDMARPVLYTGTQELCGIYHPDMENGFELHSVQGVFEVTKTGMAPIDPGILFVSAPSWESEEITDSEGHKHHRLNLHYPTAFQDPKTLSINARWIQPWFSNTLSQRLEIAPFSRGTVGLDWRLALEPIPHVETPLQDNLDVFLRFLTLTNRSELSRNDLMDILQALGVKPQSRFGQILSLLADVRIETSARQEDGEGTVKYVYWLYFDDYEPGFSALMALFLRHVEAILDAWIAGVGIEVRMARSDGRHTE
ncbi:type VI secretion system baseplate subunit TssF [Desulfoluna sp.]|uniref:type VI secretion system baseplate subunit TssF n=1 Tax=Desulfoluna sp. TaxID=2045199 RepID=UPI002602B89B|nr:type VI secretion system baseplate subunit TssF [Desulfoluna sp.]